MKPFNGDFPVTQGFGVNPKTYGPGGHRGIDYGTPTNTQIIAVADGVVAKPAPQPNGFGTYITLSFGEYICYYGHLLKVRKTGAVKQGEVIGWTDSTGWSTGPHLHFEVYQNRKLINPDKLLKELDMYKGKNAEQWYKEGNYWHQVAEDRQRVIDDLKSDKDDLFKAVAERDKQVKGIQKDLDTCKASSGDSTKWETLRALLRELLGIK